MVGLKIKKSNKLNNSSATFLELFNDISDSMHGIC